ncbi:PLP-dependent transferase [Acephala macrosclerotiorum]|nr:PLP-dependent transferase [Acephala macrosclerotiorum]
MHRSLIERPHEVVASILNGCGGAAVAVIGHSNQEVIFATLIQMQRVSYVHTLSYTTSSAEDLASHILSTPPSGFQHSLTKAYFCSSGSETNDAAMKLARQYHFEHGQPSQKWHVSRKRSYHGNSIGSMSVSSILARKVPYEGEGGILMENVSFRLGLENVISFIAEPVVGAASGCVAAPKGYFPAVRKLCDKYGILLHLDEIRCGMGRTRTYLAFEQIQRGSKAFNHGHTYQAHPVSCAAALAVQRIMRREDLVQRCALMGMLLEKLSRDAFGECRFVGDIRGRGSFWGLEFVKDKVTKETFSLACHFGYNVQQNAFRLGLAVYPGAATVDGVRGDHVIIAPPYNISVLDLRKIVTLLKEAYLQEQSRIVI